jgi:tetrahydromethanopterin S-methyltransferase subunit A
MKLKQMLENAAGKLCEVLLPIKPEYHMGKGNSVAICTLSSIHLLHAIADLDVIMNRILIVGRLFSENKGLDKLINFTVKHPALHHIIVCGKEVRGHKTGQALISVHRNGATKEGRIIGAIAPHPFLTCSQTEIELFRRQCKVYDLIDNEDLKTIKNIVSQL